MNAVSLWPSSQAPPEAARQGSLKHECSWPQPCFSDLCSVVCRPAPGPSATLFQPHSPLESKADPGSLHGRWSGSGAEVGVVLLHQQRTAIF